MDPHLRVSSLRAGTAGTVEDVVRAVPEEVPVALVYDGSTHAVMMASPADLEDFAVGFSLTEGIVASAREITEVEIVEHANGIEARMWLESGVGRSLAERRRRIAGPTACGLCGVESLEAAVPAPPKVAHTLSVTRHDIQAALAAMSPAQTLNRITRAVHAAGFYNTRTGMLDLLREDVGRHNALDKLVGAMARRQVSAAHGFVVLTSRVSVEMVQKAARLGAEVLVAVSAPTALAIRTAEEAGITLAAIARADAFEIFTSPERIKLSGLDQDRPGETLHALHV